ncbi:MAG: hypothetical protein IJ812_06540 [Schwartzia sp.]|nr:hypothetical protein [Schwartzia sp. (in: firmicutes)]MBR1886048.1 hypothetical protein [Schwartzia sp. (in: firmicutes)]
MEMFSLGLLLVAIALGFLRHMNTGLLSIAFALVLGRMAGIPDKAVVAGFNSSLFLILLGVTYLFSIAQLNGSLALLAEKVVALTGRHTPLVPVVIYLFSTVLSALGPGTVPTIAIMMVFSMTLAAEMKISPVMLAALVVLGSSGGGVSPLAATGIIGKNLCEQIGLSGVEGPFLTNGVLSMTVYAAVVYVALGGWRLHSDHVIHLFDLPAFTAKQKTTLAGIAVMVVLVMFFHFNVGLTSFAVAAVLSFLKVADEAEALKNVPWGTLILIGGVSVLMNLIIKLGGIELLSDALASIMTPSTATAIMGVTAGCMSWCSSTSGVVMPTLIPTIPTLTANLGGGFGELEMATTISMISHCGGISPLSTGGGLALAAYSSAAKASVPEQHRLFIRLFAVSACGVLFLSFLSWLGLFHWML